MSGKHLVLVGPAGSGKGTQAPRMAKEYDACHLSTGDLLRDAVAAGTPLGRQAKVIMDKGELVPDNLMIDLIKENLKQSACVRGWILDGFPRTVEQAKKLDEMLAAQKQKIDRAIEFRIEDSLLIRRITGRWVHLASGRSYHVEFNPPKKPMFDDKTGEPLEQRSDDNEATLKRRLESYHKNTTPVLAYYKEKGLLSIIDAAKPVDDVWNQIKKAVNK